jgi:hypothetical protein
LPEPGDGGIGEKGVSLHKTHTSTAALHEFVQKKQRVDHMYFLAIVVTRLLTININHHGSIVSII